MHILPERDPVFERVDAEVIGLFGGFVEMLPFVNDSRNILPK
jgi:hypothetical protein